MCKGTPLGGYLYNISCRYLAKNHRFLALLEVENGYFSRGSLGFLHFPDFHILFNLGR